MVADINGAAGIIDPVVKMNMFAQVAIVNSKRKCIGTAKSLITNSLPIQLLNDLSQIPPLQVYVSDGNLAAVK